MVLALVIGLVATPTAIAATEPPRHVYGEAPGLGFYELTGTGSHLLVWRDFASRYRLSVFRLRIRRGSSEACRPHKNQFAVVGGDHALRPLIAHRAEVRATDRRGSTNTRRASTEP